MNNKEVTLARKYGLSMSQKLFLDITNRWSILENCGLEAALDRKGFWPDGIPINAVRIFVGERVCSLEDGVTVALSTLKPLEQSVLRLRYYDDFTFKQVGFNLNIGDTYAQKICAKSLRKLRHPYRFGYILGYRDLPAEDYTAPVKRTLGETPLEALDLSSQSYRKLTNAGFNTIGDIMTLHGESVDRLNKLGRTTVDEVYEAIKNYTAD